MKRILNKRNIFVVILLFIFLFAVSKIVLFALDLYSNKKTNDSLINDVFKVEIDSATNKEIIKINFNKLMKMNSDTVGWIIANGNKINYPIVQGETNEDYLTKTIEKKYNQAGSIFMDYRNRSFDDQNVVLFGHSMLDKTMFGSLNDVFKTDFFDKEENRYIKIVDPSGRILTYEIISYYIIDKEEYYITTSFLTTMEYQNFLDTILSRSNKKLTSSLTTDDKILTLSTCAGTGNTNKRKVIHAKRIAT